MQNITFKSNGTPEDWSSQMLSDDQKKDKGINRTPSSWPIVALSTAVAIVTLGYLVTCEVDCFMHLQVNLGL